MYLHKWNEALVDWVNCLALTPSISDLSELEDGKFFSSLLKNIILVEDLEGDFSGGGLEVVFQQLKKEFPLYGVCNIQSEGNAQVSYISSLLLLLSVTKGKTPLCCSRLCEDLKHESQVKIKCFLESCIAAGDQLDHSHLKSIIEGDYVPSKVPTTPSQTRVTELSRTPMKEFFESPRLTDKLSKDLRRLEAELEALQLEKLELEDELRIEKEKSVQLEERLNKKSKQVVKLREELTEYSQTVDDQRKADGIDMNNQRIHSLTSELEESEKYIKELVDERDAVNQEKVKLKEKLAAAQGKIMELEATALSCESSNVRLQMSLTQKEQELEDVKIHCCELKEKIQALNLQHNVSIDSETSMSGVAHFFSSPFAGGERVSQAVIDLKLAEVEEENEKLKSQVDAEKEKSQKLLQQLVEVKEKLEKARTAQEAAVSENNKTRQELHTCLEEREKLRTSFREATEKISDISEINSCLKQEFFEVNHKLSIAEDSIQRLEKDKSSMEVLIQEKDDLIGIMKEELEDKKDSYEALASIKFQLEYDLSECKKERDNLKMSLDDASKKIFMLTEEMSSIREKLTNLEDGYEALASSKVQLEHEFNECKKERDDLKISLENDSIKISALAGDLSSTIDKLTNLEDGYEALASSKVQLEHEFNKCKKERDDLKISLENDSIKISALAGDLSSTLDKLTILENRYEALASSKVQLEHEFNKCKKEREDLKISLENDSIKISALAGDLSSTIEMLTNLENRYEALASSKVQLEHEFNECKKERDYLKISLEDASLKISTLTGEMSSLREKIENLKKGSEVSAEHGKELKEECILLNQEVNEKQKKIDNLKGELRVLAEEKLLLEKNFSDSERNYQALRGEFSEENQKRITAEKNFECVLKSLETEVSTIIQTTEMSPLISDSEMPPFDKVYELLKFLQDYHLLCFNSNKELKSSIGHLENNIVLLKETSLKEKTDNDVKFSNAVDKINNLESFVKDLEGKIQLLEDQLTEKNLLVHEISNSIVEKEEKLEALKKDNATALKLISEKEDELNKLREKRKEEESIIRSLKSDRDALACEKNNFSHIVDELRKTIDGLQQQHEKYIEEKLSMESELREMSCWKSRCELLEEKIKEFNRQKALLTVSQPKENVSLQDSPGENIISSNHLTFTKEVSPICDEKNPQGNMNVTVVIPKKSSHGFETKSAEDEEKISQQIPCDSGICRQLGLEEKLWKIIRSWHETEIELEKIEETLQNFNSKVSSLWDSLPQVLLKCKKLFNTQGSSQLMGKEAEQSKEVQMLLKNMLLALEKEKRSLEQELMYVSHRAVSCALSGIQCSFETSPVSSGVAGIECAGKAFSISSEGTKDELSVSFEKIKEKFAIAFLEVDSTARVFQEVEQKCGSAEDAIGYLKKNGNLLMSEDGVVVDELYPEKLTNESEKVSVKESLEEMEKAKLNLQKISRSYEEQLSAVLSEKEALEKKMTKLQSQNDLLVKEMHSYTTKIQKETSEAVQKIFQEKLQRVTKKMELAYQADLEQFTKASDKADQLDGLCKKYRHTIQDYEKRLYDLNSQNQNLQQKVENLKKQKSILEDKLNYSKMHHGFGDAQGFMTPDLSKSRSVEHLSNYFAKGQTAGMDLSKFLSERSPSALSTISKESGQSNLPSGMGQVFCAEDEEGESFNTTFLSDLKEGRCVFPNKSEAPNRKTLAVLPEPNGQSYRGALSSQLKVDSPTTRLLELRRRNTLCLPHLKSSYPAETQVQDPRHFPDDNLKGNFSLKAPLLSENQPRRLSGNNYGDPRRRKDKGQIVYMRPGPPTPGKNRRSSLQGSEVTAEPKIQSTPGRILSWLGRKKRNVADAENIPVTPRSKQKGMLRHPATKLDHDEF